MTAPLLLTNDDGLHCVFLHILAEALAQKNTVVIAAPSTEQSWIGRAVSRRQAVKVTEESGFPGPAWAIGGSPTDCVNIALGNLLPERPRAIVSGINVGYNTTTPLIYSSGTVAGAMEGAFWGLPAFAVSQALDRAHFLAVQDREKPLQPEVRKVLESNAAHAAETIGRLLHEEPGEDAVVHNLNYPFQPRRPYELRLTIPAQLREMSLYEKGENGQFQFHYKAGEPLPSAGLTDREAIENGLVSHSILNFSALGRDLSK